MPWGLYKWIRIPFSLTNTPGSFQRYMEESLGDLWDQICLPYLDDVIVYSGTFEEHIESVRKVLRRRCERGIKLKAKKCQLFMKEVCYLGQLVSADGHRMDPKNVEPIEALKETRPKTVSEVRKLLGFLGYYRHYIKDFARMAQPINDLLKVGKTQQDKAKVPVNKRTAPRFHGQAPPNQKVNWTEKQTEALHALISFLLDQLIMAFPDYNLPYILHTDASTEGLGAILYQRQAGKVRVIAYASKTLSPTEWKYHMHSGKLEFLTLKWAVTKKFCPYLYHAPSFDIYTDNNPLTYINTTAKLNATSHRWVAELADYNFKLHYHPGKASTDADFLSRLPHDIVSLDE